MPDDVAGFFFFFSEIGGWVSKRRNNGVKLRGGGFLKGDLFQKV